VAKQEFGVAGAFPYDRRSPVRWIVSHLLRNRRWLAFFVVGTILSNAVNGGVPLLVGRAFNSILQPATARDQLPLIALEILGLVLLRAAFDLVGRFSAEIMAKRFKRDAREELFASLLGKSQTFHNRQQVGDLMARAANDVGQLSNMIVPGVDAIVDSFLTLVLSLVFIGILKPELLLAPLIFTVVFLIALRDYARQLAPVSGAMRGQFGQVNAGLNEAVTGIEVVKATAQEVQELRKFSVNARRFRDLSVRNGQIQARYIPPLLLTVATVGAFLHGVLLVSRGELNVGGLVAYMGLLSALGYPAFMSIFTFSLVQLGLAGARRILSIMAEETELDENQDGYAAQIRGEVVFDDVSFGYGETPVLKHVSFRVSPGQTVAVVGRTGSGKSTLTKLVNHMYDPTAGHVLVDGVDVRDWSMESLRSQVSTIEQDIFLFSRSVAENIGFGLGQQVDRDAIEAAARDAQAHGFITSFREGYETVIGERGVTLSGGQRQRLAIARALLTDPRILILDDSTSAIDSATEDEIQQAIRRVLTGRTTFLITHRLSQIRWADWILLLEGGELIDQGTHEALLARCDPYRRIFSHYEAALAV
jgi:ATP-binding cassette, subfamily B, bacterial